MACQASIVQADPAHADLRRTGAAHNEPKAERPDRRCLARNALGRMRYTLRARPITGWQHVSVASIDTTLHSMRFTASSSNRV